VAEKPRRETGLSRFRGPWRVAVVESSMAPAIEPGDWLLVDPTILRWPRRGSVVVFRDPSDGQLSGEARRGPTRRARALRRRLPRPGRRRSLAAERRDRGDRGQAGFGPPVDSRQFGPVPVEALVGRVWFRYAPLRRVGRISRPD
jgi:hypothetical protein